MHIKSLAWLLALTVSPLLAQEDGASAQTPSEPETQESAAVESKSPETKAPSKAGANFQPSEEIMADTMLTLPADI
ncbi:MAG: hypothetical protein ACI89D_001887 [Bermanella sp.]|jgi:hypothetical protein